MARRLIGLGMALILLVMLGACSPAASSPTPAPQGTPKPGGTAPAAKAAPKPPEKIKYMSPTAGVSFLPAFFGKEKGIFAEEGLDPEFIVLKGELGVPALLNGEVEFAGLLEPALQAAMRGEPVRNIMVQKSRASWRIIMGKGITSPEQLKGKAIGVSTLGSSNQYAAQKGLEKLGLDPAKDVTFIVLPDKDTVPALQSGSVGAAVITPPYSNLAVAAGFKEAINTAEVVPIATTGVATTIKRLQENPDQVKRLLRALLKSLAYVRDHKDEAVQYAVKQYDLDAATADAIVTGAIQEYSYDGSVSDKSLEATLEMMKAGGGPWKDATLDQLKKGTDNTLLLQVQKELGITK